MVYSLRLFFSLIMCFIASISFSQNKELELRNLVENSKDSTLVNAYLSLAKYYYQTTGKGDSLLLYSQKALDLSLLLKNEALEIESLKYIGVGFLTMRDFENSEITLKKGLKIAKNNNAFKLQAEFYNKLGTLYQNMNNNTLAIEHLLNAARYSEKIDDYKNIAQSYYGISFIYANQKQFDKQLEYIKKSIDIINNNDIKDPLMENIIFSYAGQQYLELYLKYNEKEYLNDAYDYAKKALKIANTNNFNSRKISSFSILSSYYLSKNDFKNAELYAKKTLEFRELASETILTNVYLNLGNIYSQRNDKYLALSFVDSLNTLKTKSEPYYCSVINNFSYRIYKQFNYTKQALEKLEAKSECDKILYDNDKLTLVNELETKYKTELKDTEIKNLSQQQTIDALELDKKQAQINKLIVFLILAMLLLISILFITKIIQLKRTRQKNYELKLAFDKQIKLEKELSDVRDEIAQDFHDDLGNKLARISLLSYLISGEVSINDPKVKSKIKQITEDANGLYRGTRDFVFSLKSNSDYLDEIITYLSDFGEDYFSKTKIKFIVEKDISINDKLPHYWNKQLIYIFKEALTNTLKHSQCDSVILSFVYKNNQLTITSKDNGIGMTDEEMTSSNGLLNMKNRAIKIGGLLQIDSETNKGTTITFIGNTDSK